MVVTFELLPHLLVIVTFHYGGDMKTSPLSLIIDPNKLRIPCLITLIIWHLIWAVGSTASTADELIMIDARINGHAVRLAFETGAEYSILRNSLVERIDLKWEAPPSDVKASGGKVPMGLSEPFLFTLGEENTPDARFRIFNIPKEFIPKVDGFLAWSNVVNSILLIDAEAKKVLPLSLLPRDIDSWAESDIRDDELVLTLKLINKEGRIGSLLIDTGFADGGVQLSEERWRKWKDENKEQPFTFTAIYSSYSGLTVYETYCAENFTIGSFKISNVPVTKSSSGAELFVKDHQATLGLFALSQFEIILDGKKLKLFSKPQSNPKSEYQYNRAGAVFIPENLNSVELKAHVVESGPAYEVGIRNGDILLRIDDLDVTKWRTDPNVLPLGRFWSRPAGSTLKLSLLRNGKPLTTELELQEILPNCVVEN